MIASGERPKFVPAAMIDRVIARGLDLLSMGTVFALVTAPLVVAGAAINLSSMLEPGRDPGLGNFFAALVLGGLAAACWEPTRQMSKGRSFGKAVVGIELRVGAKPDFRASTARALTRYAVSAGACGASVSLALATTLVAGIDLTARRVVGLVAIPSLVVWATALLSALLRSDRRGWHDLVAGTVLVSRLEPPSRGDVRNQDWDQGPVDRAR